MSGYALSGIVLHDGPSNPLFKNVIREAPAWFANYRSMPLTLLAPALGIIGAILAIALIKRAKVAFVCSAGSVFGIIATVGVSMFPFVLPSSSNPEQSLIVWDSTSSQLTLLIMLIATVIFLPLILVYTGWVYRVLRGKTTAQTIQDNHEAAY